MTFTVMGMLFIPVVVAPQCICLNPGNWSILLYGNNAKFKNTELKFM